MQTKHIQLLLDQYSSDIYLPTYFRFNVAYVTTKPPRLLHLSNTLRQLRSSTLQQHSVSTTRLNIGNEAYLLLRQTYRLNCQPDTLQSCGCQTSFRHYLKTYQNSVSLKIIDGHSPARIRMKTTANIEGYLYCSVNRVIYYRLIIIFAIIVCISNNGIFYYCFIVIFIFNTIIIITIVVMVMVIIIVIIAIIIIVLVIIIKIITAHYHHSEMHIV